ncbi:MAG: hypothetical protein KGI39_02820 [Patescibacteria group bacterium]|nr:hypothetical protein [Patescibacteria group bacterium]
MDGKFQTSFIPKKPVMSSAKNRGAGIGLFMVVSIFIFIVSLVLAGIVFAGQKYLSSQIEKDKQDLTKAEEAFDVKTIEALSVLDKRIKSAKNILNKHVAVMPIFDYLESNTLKNIRFKSMALSFSDKNTVDLEMKGESKNFNAVALQSDLFAENKNFKNPLISGTDLTSAGDVVFNFKTQVEPSLLLYKNTAVIQQ